MPRCIKLSFSVKHLCIRCGNISVQCSVKTSTSLKRAFEVTNRTVTKKTKLYLKNLTLIKSKKMWQYTCTHLLAVQHLHSMHQAAIPVTDRQTGAHNKLMMHTRREGAQSAHADD